MMNHPNLSPIFRQTKRELFEKLGKEQLTPAMVLCPGVLGYLGEPTVCFKSVNQNGDSQTGTATKVPRQIQSEQKSNSCW